MNSLRQSVGSDALAATFALPHENKGQRLPTIPAVMTAVVDLMCDATRSVETSKRFALCRDTCYPLWSDRTVQACGGLSAGSIELPPTLGGSITVPPFNTKFSTTRSVDAITLSATEFEDTCVIVGLDNQQVLYIPTGAYYQFVFELGGAPTPNSALEIELRSYIAGDWAYTRALTTISGNSHIFIGLAGAIVATSGALVQGAIPQGFTELVAVRVVGTAPAVSVWPCTMYHGWSSAVTVVPAAPAASSGLFVPAFRPAEFRNSTLPYRKTRLNASAVLMTNVTPVLEKEGTVLAGRLQTSTVDMFNFSAASIDACHPSQRYFGALENGLYSFTAPSANVEQLVDHVGTVNSVEVPTFDYKVDSLYNAMILTDLDAAASTTIALSLYVHLEFACTSSLFAIAVSSLTIETLHQAEVKLLRAGYFHENSTHVPSVQRALRGRQMPQRVMSQVTMLKPKQKKVVQQRTTRGRSASARPKKGGKR
jgi:hypothetical protein